MCERWASSFINFLADMGPAPAGHTIDRIDVNGNYEPGNCRWATNFQQSRNKQNSLIYEWGGIKMPLKDIADKEGVKYKSLHGLMKYDGLSLQEAIARLQRHRK